jgi:very-short-patch-repair endonuclease
MPGEQRQRASRRPDAVVSGRADAAVARIAGRQHGNATTGQLKAAGLGEDAITTRRKRGLFRPMHRGVVFVGQGEITPKARAMAAVLACGGGSVVSHRSAAYLYGALPYPAHYREIDVTVASRKIASPDGIKVHRTTGFDRRDVRTLDGIPITSPARTLLDIAATAPDELDAAFDEAIFHKVVRPPQLRELVSRSAGRAGVKALCELYEAEAAGERSRLEAEKRFRRLVKAAGLPKPEPNARVGRFVVDLLWPEQRVVAELDGFGTHRKRAAFEGDRARDGDLQALDYRVVRVTWRQLTREPYVVVARVAAVLALGGRDAATPGSARR